MSDNRKLLELAAKAAGMVDWRWYEHSKCLCHYNVKMGRWYGDHYNDKFEWNPIIDDGDALRLAVKLEIDVSFYEHPEHKVYAQTKHMLGVGTDGYASYQAHTPHMELCNNDHYAATRRAIVRAAAEIGRNMK